MDAKTAADILKTQGPMALALVLVSLLLFLETSAFIAFVSKISTHISEKTVPISVHEAICEIATQGIQEIKSDMKVLLGRGR